MEIIATKTFIQQTDKLDKSEKEKLSKKIDNIINGKVRGKPLRYDRKGTCELYMGSKRLYFKLEENVLYLLEYSHKKKQ